MSQRSRAISARNKALLEHQLAQHTLGVALADVRQIRTQHPLRLVLVAATAGWALGRMGVGARLLRTAAGLTNAQTLGLVQQVLRFLR